MSATVHNRSTYNNHGCRCETCCADATKRMSDYRARRAARRFPVEFDGKTFMVHPDAKHGTTDGYENYSCRCPDCRQAHRDYARTLTARKRAEASA